MLVGLIIYSFRQEISDIVENRQHWHQNLYLVSSKAGVMYGLHMKLLLPLILKIVFGSCDNFPITLTTS